MKKRILNARLAAIVAGIRHGEKYCLLRMPAVALHKRHSIR